MKRSLINALGSGILETRALAAFMPRLCKHLHNTGLELPEIATWSALADAEKLVIWERIEARQSA